MIRGVPGILDKSYRPTPTVTSFVPILYVHVLPQ